MKGHVLRWGLVIQGPLISTGRHGASAGVPASLVTDADVVTYDCRKHIDRLVKDVQFQFDAGIVVVTWQGEVPTNILGAHRLDLPPVPAPSRGKRLHSAVSANNKLRQFQSSLAGTEWLAEAGADLVIKIRTDTILDVALLARFTERKVLERRNIIVVPYLRRQESVRSFGQRRNSHFAIPDFYFGGAVDSLRRFFYAQTWSGHADFAESVHYDMALRYAFALDHDLDQGSPRISGTRLEYFAGANLSPSNRRVIQQVVSREFIAGPRSVWEGLVWRGEKFARADLDMRLFDARWPTIEGLNPAQDRWDCLQDALLTGYGRAARLYAFATTERVWWLLLADRAAALVLISVRLLRTIVRRIFQPANEG